MAADGMDLRDDRDVRAGVVSLDGGAHAGTTGTDDEDVVLGFHSGMTLHDAGGCPAQ
jgi:hypothetical protein